jgi:hypothetical protein
VNNASPKRENWLQSEGARNRFDHIPPPFNAADEDEQPEHEQNDAAPPAHVQRSLNEVDCTVVKPDGALLLTRPVT